MADFDFSGVDALSKPAAPAANPTAPAQGEFDFSGVDAVKDYGTTGEMAKTAAEQAASGATLGLSKVAQTQGIPALGIPPISTPEDIAGREKENPKLAMASNIAGTAAMIYGTGGLGSIPEGAGVAARVGLGALEGAGIGGISQATDDWSQNKALDAGKIIASAGFGAALGGGGAAALSAIGGTASKLSKTLDFFSKFADEAASKEGYIANIAKGFQSAGDSVGALTSDLTEHFGELYKLSKRAISDVYEKAGDFHLNQALEDTTLTEAQQAALQTGEKVKALITRPGEAAPVEVDEWGHTLPQETVEPESTLSPHSDKIVQQRLQTLEQELNSAQSAREVHDALTGFATDLDKGKLIKFDKIPTAGQMADQDILHTIRNTVRGDLKNPDIWGNDAALHYTEMSNLYRDQTVARKNFERDFMKNRIGPQGQTIKVVDPAKVGALFKDFSAPNQQLKKESLMEFIHQSLGSAIYAEDYQGFQHGMDALSDRMIEHLKGIGSKASKQDILQLMEKAKKGHGFDIGDLMLEHALPPELAAPLMVLKRYSDVGTKRGALLLGKGIYKSVNTATNLAKHVEAATNKIDKGARAIFSGSSSQNRE